MKNSKFPRLAFDMSSIMWTAIRRGEDAEHGRKVVFNGKPVQVNSAIYGYDRSMLVMMEMMETFGMSPIHCVLVFEGLSSKSQRTLRYSGYKGGEGKAPEEYEQFHIMKGMLSDRWSALGVTMVEQDYAEGDDTLGYLAVNTESDLTIVSNDGDLSILAGTNAYGAQVNVWSCYHREMNRNPIAPVSTRHLTLYKSLVGDTSDNIKGCVGFGDKAWEALVKAYGEDGLDELNALIRDEQKGPLMQAFEQTKDPALAKIIDQWAAVTSSYYVATIHPEWVNGPVYGLKITPGFVQKAPTDFAVERYLAPLYATGRLITKGNIEKAVAWMLPQFAVSDWVSLDIETAPDDESIQWAQALGKGEKFVDVLGAKITGLSLTFGENQQHSVYFSIDHYATDNLSFAEVWSVVQMIPSHLEVVIQNVNFELPVLYMESCGVHIDNSEFGFLPRVQDTKLEAAYVNEDIPRGLKERSQTYLNYTQVTYEEVTRVGGNPEKLYPGGTVLESGVNAEGQPFEVRRYNMRQLPARHVTTYALDDTRCTSALHNFYRLVMELEHTWQVYQQVEIDAAYSVAASFLDGVPFSVARMKELAAKDKTTMEVSWSIIKSYLMEKGWAGTICPELSDESTAKQLKEALTICSGFELETRTLKFDKLLLLMQSLSPEDIQRQWLEDAEREGRSDIEYAELVWRDIGVFANRLSQALAGDWAGINSLLREKFTGEPVFNFGSPKQKITLLYEVMGLPVRVRNKPTAKMKAAGVQGSPSTDALAVNYAIRDADPKQRVFLEAIQLYISCRTKFSLYYDQYPDMLHWRDGKLHPSVNQCQANTLRGSCATPNFQQMPKHPKIEGQIVEFRECIVPHKKNAVVCSMDFKAQELVIIADYSRDPNMVACFVGDKPLDMHTLTGMNILKITKGLTWSYDEFTAYRKGVDLAGNPVPVELEALADKARVDGKKVNFTTEYGAMAAKLAATMMVDEDTAQNYIDAKLEAFPVADKWKDDVIIEAKAQGYATTKMGARRHLREAFNGSDRWLASKAERQAVNFKVQSSSAEQTKLAQGRAWRAGLIFKYDCSFYGPIHDELVWSCVTDQLEEFIPALHACMVAPYADVTLPIRSDISFGPNFGQQIEIGAEPTLAAIAAGKVKLMEMLSGKVAA